MAAFATWLVFLIPITGFVVTLVLMSRRSRQRLHEWATAQGYDVIRVTNPPLFRPGPFFLQSARGWGIAQIIVRTKDSSERIGWVRYPIGLGAPAGDLSRIQLVWDDEWDRNRPPLGPWA